MRISDWSSDVCSSDLHTPLVWFIGSTLALSLLLIIGWRTQFIIPAVILFGMGTGLAFSLVMMWFILRTRTTREAARISGLAQSFGYALAAIGPTLFGALHDWVGNWAKIGRASFRERVCQYV